MSGAPGPSRPLTRSMASPTIRRSPRLNSTHDKSSPSAGSFTLEAHHGSKKRKRPLVLLEQSPKSASRKACGPQTQVHVHHVGPRPTVAFKALSVRTAASAACNRDSSRVRELEDALDAALHAKQELAVQIAQHTFRLAQSTLRHLEEYFTCPLCFDILACPYALTPQNCGHTFCGSCILKWFFSHVHESCGGWHDPVYCPLCRSTLPDTPIKTPRSSTSFPFTPNRTADKAIRGLMDSITLELDAVSTIAPFPLTDWHEDGLSKREWSTREMEGRTEMTVIAEQWNTLKPIDFVNIKNRLEV